MGNTISDLFQAVDSNDWNAMSRIFHADVTYERPGYEPFVGRERVLQFYSQERVIASGKHQLEQVVFDHDQGACWGRFVGLKKDGSEVDERFADVYCFEDGKIKSRRSYFYRPAV